MPQNPLSKAHGFVMRSISLRDMQISKSEKILAPSPAKCWGHPWWLLIFHNLAFYNFQSLNMLALYIYMCV